VDILQSVRMTACDHVACVVDKCLLLICRGATQWQPDKITVDQTIGPVLKPDPKQWRWKMDPWNRKYSFVIFNVLSHRKL